MKVEVIIDEEYKETIIKIFANSYSKDIENLEKSLNSINNNIFIGFDDEDVYIIAVKDIVRFYTENNDIIIEDLKKSYKSRLRLYEIYSRLDKRNFIQISRSEIINISFIKKLDLSFKGTIAVELKNGETTYVSRRNLKEFKNLLGF
ncbi:LytTR family DNA-binding domain-containing protein [Peptoniphilus raoultii]|uniref:LytTR family DNA-binding domain-containing protein n=1 Tax=Peptoniphilus raoultii TaxID=1776387 RepID=UPI0008D9DD78|nr:LytTR family DNA-binding domain-containing protein [Peptoniphilus raoultii]